ncbi:hypothetical protein GIB67_041077 [Kingdonia uniflora]|uniref:Root phototropism protein 2 n=1 Tax=Kingdonia uniflora TaxID=39325 RepID=A0A7J7LKB9_9MAGN|nr:hypothetical protein GIB67_041077 [Kingdonia uniflora]
MTTSSKNNNNTNTNNNSSNRFSLAMERTGQWVFSQEIPTDVVVEVGEAKFSLHKFMLLAKSDYIRKLIMESKDTDFTHISLSDIPGGPEIFEKAAKFCYSVNFEITVQNVAALYCAAEYLEMTEKCCEGNLVGRTNEFLAHVALKSLSGAIVVLKSCEDLFPMAEELNIVKRCVDAVSIKACNEANFPSRSPTNWWTEELTNLDIDSFEKVISSMKSRGAKAHTLSSALVTYTEKSLRELVRDHSGNAPRSLDSKVKDFKRNILETIVRLLPTEKSSVSVNFVCCLLRSAIFLNASSKCRNDLEKRISPNLENITVDELLVISFTYDGEKLFDLESVRRIISGFVEKEKSVGVFNAGKFKEVCSTAMQRVAKTVDSYLGEIATSEELSISKFNGIANIVPKTARKIDDDLYRAIDIYLKAHPALDEIEREKVCSVMDSHKLSYEARLHASQNKRLPVQIVLQALYYDQLKLRSGVEEQKTTQDAISTRSQLLQPDMSLVKENEALRSELMKMKMYITDMKKSDVKAIKAGPGSRRSTFFSSVSKTLGKLNPFKQGSKDTSNVEDISIDLSKPRRRRFSIS